MKQRLITLFASGLLVALALFGSAMAGPLEDGEAAFQRSDYAEAMRLLRPLAEHGDANAQFRLPDFWGLARAAEKSAPAIGKADDIGRSHRPGR
jgi:TPR repeat protein